MSHLRLHSFSSGSTSPGELKRSDESYQFAVPHQPYHFPAPQQLDGAGQGNQPPQEPQTLPSGAVRSQAAPQQQYDSVAFPHPQPPLAPYPGHVAPVQNNAGAPPPQHAFKSLWLEQALAIMAGTLSLTLGALGLAAYCLQGPLSTAFIPAARFSGSIVNGSNIGSLVAGVATALAGLGQRIVAGVSRAYLRRKAVRGEPITIKQWKTLSSGIALYRMRKTPWVACGIMLAFMLAMAIQSSAFVGVAIPTARTSTTPAEYGPIIPYLNNGGSGPLVNCVNIAVQTLCLTYSSIPTIANAFFQVLGANSTGLYSLQDALIYSSTGFMAAVQPLAVRAGLAPNVEQPVVFAETIAYSPVSIYNSTCVRIEDAAIDQGRYSFFSACFNATVHFGNATITQGNYITGTVCGLVTDDDVYMVEIGVGGPVYGRVNDDRTYSVRCVVSGKEGMGYSTYIPGVAGEIFATIDDTFQSLSGLDMITMGTGFLAAIESEVGLNGKLGVMGNRMSSAVMDDGSIDIELISNSLSNAWAAAASAGYNLMVGSGGSIYNFTSTIPSQPVYWVFNGYGWVRSTRLLAYSILCILVGMAWFGTAGYMIGGGTRYDPTNWYQTLNTAAGSDIRQQGGTCTGGNIRAKDIDDNLLWYGELIPNHVGFGQAPTSAIDPKQKYGYAYPTVSIDDVGFTV